MPYNSFDDQFSAESAHAQAVNNHMQRLAAAKQAMTVAWKKAEATGALGSFSMKTLHDYYTALPEVQTYLQQAAHVTTAKWIITKHLNGLISSYVQSLSIVGFEQRVAAENRSGS